MAFGELRRVAMAARCYGWVGIFSSGLCPAPLSWSPEVLCFVQSSSAMSDAFEHGMGVGPKSKIDEESWEKNGKMGVSGRVCWYVACYDFVLGFNVSSLVLMIFQVGFWGSF